MPGKQHMFETPKAGCATPEEMRFAPCSLLDQLTCPPVTKEPSQPEGSRPTSHGPNTQPPDSKPSH